MRLPASWDRLREQAQGDLEALSTGNDEPVEDWDEILDRAWLAGARRFDPSAQTQPRLDVRIKGAAVGEGALSMRLVDELAGPLQTEVEAASRSTDDDTELELAGISRGSAILHLRPRVAATTPNEHLPLAVSRVDSAIRRVFDIHDAMESEAPVNSVQMTRGSQQALEKLTKVLQQHALSIEMTWRSLTADRRHSTLGERGLEYAASLFEASDHQDIRVVSGYLFELSLNGNFKLKVDASNAKSATSAVKIDPSVLSQRDLRLGQYLRVVTLHRYRMDRFGRRSRESFEFQRFMERDEIQPNE